MLLCASGVCPCLQYGVLCQLWLKVWDVISGMSDGDNLFQKWRFKKFEFINVNNIMDVELMRKVQTVCIGSICFQNSVSSISQRVQLVTVSSFEVLFI